MNEILFFAQILIVVGGAILAARLGQMALSVLVSLNAILANLFVMKQMQLFGLTVTCSDVFAVGSIVAFNLLQERFGKDAAKKALHISFLCLVFFVSVSQIHLALIPSLQDTAHGAFAQILDASPRIIFASLAVFYMVQRFDLLFFGVLKKAFQGRRFGLRMGISLVTSQFLDTVLFSFAGLYGIVASIFDVILMSFAIKCAVIACSSGLASMSRESA